MAEVAAAAVVLVPEAVTRVCEFWLHMNRRHDLQAKAFEAAFRSIVLQVSSGMPTR